LIQQLVEKVNSLKAELERLQKNAGQTVQASCKKIEKDLYYGTTEKSQVECLQEFLKSQGTDIYPEGYITGNFGDITFAAVKKFQKKYASEILAPLGVLEATGFVGQKTRDKINQMIAE
jgi:peptidoglycan hydrolase-like protein with peptidoglycan-binding domain